MTAAQNAPSGLKVLFAEDNLVVATAFRRALQQAGFRVDHCPDGESALKMIQEKDYDVIVLDLMMPKLDGLSLIKQAQVLLRSLKTPVIVFSAVDLPLVRDEAKKCGIKDFLSKEQTTPATLLEAIRAARSLESAGQPAILRMAPPAPLSARRISTLTPNEFEPVKISLHQKEGKGLIDRILGG